MLWTTQVESFVFAVAGVRSIFRSQSIFSCVPAGETYVTDMPILLLSERTTPGIRVPKFSAGASYSEAQAEQAEGKKTKNIDSLGKLHSDNNPMCFCSYMSPFH